MGAATRRRVIGIPTGIRTISEVGALGGGGRRVIVCLIPVFGDPGSILIIPPPSSSGFSHCEFRQNFDWIEGGEGLTILFGRTRIQSSNLD